MTPTPKVCGTCKGTDPAKRRYFPDFGPAGISHDAEWCPDPFHSPRPITFKEAKADAMRILRETEERLAEERKEPKPDALREAHLLINKLEEVPCRDVADEAHAALDRAVEEAVQEERERHGGTA